MDERSGQNVLVLSLAERELDPVPGRNPKVFRIEDNVGEAIHIHHRNVRLEMTIDDFLEFYENVEQTLGEL
ncbi:hypothetical protein [Natrarchaeobius chitinivorans]|uniref:Uncharacterized protein n=1 Tax=Natrarchaeobius chitinivorans TaxID=1679083 RepID=A0A3N6LWJ7_NATCH|nr:hypothetical protein [Natrarchaeobius chitinivorans]RQG92064.1 hypothetical protein EA473_17545 [Natrarchaeobius chitinivorans]